MMKNQLDLLRAEVAAERAEAVRELMAFDATGNPVHLLRSVNHRLAAEDLAKSRGVTNGE
jgi:hypothetical protein